MKTAVDSSELLEIVKDAPGAVKTSLRRLHKQADFIMSQSKFSVLCLSAVVLSAPALAQLAPAGFTGVINTPTADVLNPGTLGAAWSNSNPEKSRDFPGVGGFGSLNVGFGVLPGLELVGRLAFDGDLQCSMYVQNPPCQASTRDLSAGGKYQLPLRLGWNTRFAFGAVDVGGAATNFRSYYGVATSSVGPVDFSLGYGKGGRTYSSLDGAFGSAQVFLTEHWQALAEYDGRESRAGIRYSRPVFEQVALDLGASRKLTSSTEQQTWQLGLGLTYTFGKQAAAKVAGAGIAASSKPALPLPTTPNGRAEQLADRLRAAGFSSVWVGFDDAKGWVVQAEPVNWRKNRLDALGVALSVWQKNAQAGERVLLALSYLQNPVLTVRTTALCLARFVDGGWPCEGQAALVLDNGEAARAPQLGWTVAATSRAPWEALNVQFEVGPALRQRVGTEFGLYDASVGLDLGWEMALGHGFLWQGQATVPLANTQNFANGGIFSSDRIQSRLESTTVSYQQQLAPRLWAQASVGYIEHNDLGGQVDLAWLSPAGRLRLSAMGGYYQGTDPTGLTQAKVTHPTALLAARSSVIDGRWMLEAQGGQFYNQDRGIRLASHHWFGDNRLTLQYRNSASSDAPAMPRTSFAGFVLSIPIGGQASYVIPGLTRDPWIAGQARNDSGGTINDSGGAITLRGRDQWTYGLETKVGSTDNYITSGYGVVPAIRHGLMTDTLDYDRAGLADMTANFYRVRAMLREML